MFRKLEKVTTRWIALFTSRTTDPEIQNNYHTIDEQKERDGALKSDGILLALTPAFNIPRTS